MVKFKEFRVGDLFDKLSTPCLKSGNKKDYVLNHRTKEYHIPMINAKAGNNGVMYWTKDGCFETYHDCIGVVADGAVSTGMVYLYPFEVSCLYNAYLIKLKADNPMRDNFLVNAYLATCIEKITLNSYSYTRKAIWAKVQNDFVKLPVDTQGQPDWHYMNEYMQQIEAKYVQQTAQKYQQTVQTYQKVIKPDVLSDSYTENVLKQYQNADFRKFHLGDLFEIEHTNSFNKNKLTTVSNESYDYITRTAENRGVLQTTGFVNDDNLNDADTFSLGLLQMTFYYRNRPWYAGQFVRKIVPKFKMNRLLAEYFETVFNQMQDSLKSVLVRYVDDSFNESLVKLPVTASGEPDFTLMSNYIKVIQQQYVDKLQADLNHRLAIYQSLI